MNTLTKIFVVLQLVLALVLAVLVVLFAYKQPNYKEQLQVEQKSRIAAAAALAQQETQNTALLRKLAAARRAAARQAGALQSQIINLEGQVAGDQTEIAQIKAAKCQMGTNVSLLTNTVHSLNKQVADETAQLNTLRPSLLRYINENAQLNRRVDQLTDERDAARKTIQTLQESIVALNHKLVLAAAKTTVSPQRAVNLRTMIGTPTPVRVNGIIRRVRTFDGRTYVSTSLGRRDGIHKGTRLTIYRDHKYIGDAIVQRVDTTESVGVVTLQAPGAKIDTADLVMSGPGL